MSPNRPTGFTWQWGAGRTEAATKPALLSIFPYCPPSASGARRNLAGVSGKEKKKKKNRYIDVSANVRQLRLNRGCQASHTMRLVTLLHCKRLRFVQKNWRRKGGKKTKKKKTKKQPPWKELCFTRTKQLPLQFSLRGEWGRGRGEEGGGGGKTKEMYNYAILPRVPVTISWYQTMF